MPRVGSAAKACTDCTMPERTKKLPSKLSENANKHSSKVVSLKP